MASSSHGPAPAQAPQLADAIKLLVEKLAPKKAEPAPAQPPSSLQQIGAAFSQVAGVAGQVVGALQQVVATTQGWVAALAPNIVQAFNQAMRDLQATLGTAFTGIFTQGIGFLKQLAAQIAPVLAQLKPVVDQLVSTALGNLTAIVRAVVPLLAGLLPVLRALATIGEAVGAVLRPVVALIGGTLYAAMAPLVALFDVLNAVLGPFVRIGAAVFSGLATVIQAWVDVFQVAIETMTAALAGLLGVGDVKDVIKQVNEAFLRLRNAVVLSAARLALLAGNTEYVRKLIEKYGAVGAVAAGATSIKALEQIGKDLAQASVNAVAAGGEGETDVNKELVNELKRASEGIRALNATLSRPGTLAGNAARLGGAPNTGRALDVGYSVLEDVGGFVYKYHPTIAAVRGIASLFD